MNLLPRIERYDVSAICRPGAVVHAGRRAVRIGFGGNSTTPQILPVKIIVASAASLILPRRSDDCCRTLQPLQASGSFFDRTRGTIPVDLNLGGAYGLHSLFSSLRHALQKPCSVFAVLFRPSLSVRVIHDTQHGENDVEKIRKYEWRNPNVVG
jgi:hypothetical protein